MAGIPDATQDVGDHEDEEAGRVDAARVSRELGQQRGQRGERQRQRTQGGRVQAGLRERHTDRGQPRREGGRRGQDRRAGQDERREDGRVPADPPGQHRLHPPVLLLATGGPGHQRDPHQRHHEGGEEAELVLDHAAEARDTLDPAVDGQERTTSSHRGCVRADLGRGVVEPRDAGRCRDHDRRRHDRPPQQQAPLRSPPDDERGPDAAPGHRAAPAGPSGSCSATSR